MDFYAQFELDETFNETIKSRYRDTFSYDSFSEGEKTRINLAILFTWRAISKMRNSAASNLLIFDEILDSSTDQVGIDSFFNIVKQLGDDNNVFVISHTQENYENRFNSIIKFAKVKNFSRIIE
jgi:energy-coupling factor transporter ATP-binding protein EcfA2